MAHARIRGTTTQRAPLWLAALLMVVWLATQPASAQTSPPPPPDLSQVESVADLLQRSVGRRVEIVLVSGEKLSGVVARATANLVHLERLSGRDFYDGVARIDRIDAVVMRMRER